MKIVSLGFGGWLAERAGIEVVYYLGGTILFLSGLTGIIAFQGEHLGEQLATEQTLVRD